MNQERGNDLFRDELRARRALGETLVELRVAEAAFSNAAMPISIKYTYKSLFCSMNKMEALFNPSEPIRRREDGRSGTLRRITLGNESTSISICNIQFTFDFSTIVLIRKMGPPGTAALPMVKRR